jgi:dipeptidyl aminopeptidase/acylaminoacyl peptidase
MKRRRQVCASAALVLGAPLIPAAAPTAFGQTAPVRPLAPETLFAARELRAGARVSLSADGRFVAYVAGNPQERQRDGDIVTTRTGWALLPSGAPSGAGQVWVLDLRTQRAIAVAGPTGHSWAPAWSPRAPVLALLSDRDGRPGLWLWRPGDRAAPRRISPMLSTDYYGSLRWTPDGRSVLLASPDPADLADALRGRGAVAPARPGDALSVEVRRAGFADSAVRAGEPAARPTSPAARFDIISVNIETGNVRRLVSDTQVVWLQPSPDGRLLAYAIVRDFSRPQGRQYQSYYSLRVVPLSGGAPRTLASDLPLAFWGKETVRWAPDSRSLAYATVGLAEEHGLFRVAVDGSGVVPLAPFRPFMDISIGQAEGVVWDSTGRALYGWSGPIVWRYDAATGEGREITRLEGMQIWHLLTRGPFGHLYEPAGSSVIAVAVADSGTSSGFYRIDVASGKVTPLYAGNWQLGVYGGFSAENTTAVSASGDVVLFARESATEPLELWRTDRRFSDVRPVSRLSGAMLDTPMGQRRIIEWTTSTGLRRRGILLLPPHYQSGTRYPLIVWMYEHSIPYDVNTFGLSGSTFFNLHLFATREYAAFYPDLEWAPESVMTSLADQVHSGVQELARLGIADSTRVGVVGHSSGGYDVFAIATTCPWVRAAVAVSGVADMVMAFGGTMDSPVGYDWVEKQMGLGAPPWAHPERYVANSPSYHFDQVQARMLLLQGTADEFNVGHMDLAYAELKRLGKVVEYRRYPGEGHVPDEWTPANRLDGERRMLEWFDTYVKGAE